MSDMGKRKFAPGRGHASWRALAGNETAYQNQ